MGLFDRLFPKKQAQLKNAESVFKMLTGYSPVFHSWRGCIYESELVRAAIDALARNISKLNIDIVGSAKPTLLTKLRNAPNAFQTWSQFMYRLATIFYIHNNAFVVPLYDTYGDITGYFPVLPERCEIVESRGVLYLRYTFADRETAAIELDKCVCLTRFQYKSDFFGESNAALTPTMEILKMQEEGIKEGIKSAASFRFMARLTNFTKDEDLKNTRDRFVADNFKKEGGELLLFPNTMADIKQIDSKPFLIDAEQMNLIAKSVYNYFGVNEDVIQNKAYGDAWSAFYEGAIEPFAIQFSEAISDAIFSQKEKAQGSYIMATSNRLQYMTNADKLNVSAQMADRGLMTRNEIRQIWNLPPLADEVGNTLPIRAEYINLTAEGETNNDNEG